MDRDAAAKLKGGFVSKTTSVCLSTMTLAAIITVVPTGAAPAKSVPVRTIILDYAADVAPTLNLQSDGLGHYLSSKTLVSEIQPIGDWVVDAINPARATRQIFVDFATPIPGSAPGGTDPIPPPLGKYAFRAMARCSVYDGGLLTFTAGQVKSCPMTVGFDIGGTRYRYVMDPLTAVNGPFPETNPATVTCIYPTTGTQPCSQWKITPSGTYVESDGTVKYRNVAKLLEDATGAAIDRGDFYVSFSIVIAK